jgi:tetrahydromethanopterin S-methyltransferase subunit C
VVQIREAFVGPSGDKIQKQIDFVQILPINELLEACLRRTKSKWAVGIDAVRSISGFNLTRGVDVVGRLSRSGLAGGVDVVWSVHFEDFPSG